MTIADGVFAAARRTPDKRAIREGERSLTFAGLAERIRRVANLAHGGLGLAKGERAAVLMPNRLEYFELVAGLSLAGVPVATIGPAASAPEIRFICEDSAARVLFVAPALEDAARAAAGDLVGRIVPMGEAYEDLIARAADGPCPVEVDERDIFSIPYTSGSTGRPKGVMLSHRARVLQSFCMAAEHGCYGPEDRAVATTPMFHGAGFLMVLAPLFFGGSVELLPRFDIGRLLGAVAETRATSVYMVPTHFSALFAMGERRHAFDLSSLKTVASGTAPLAQSLKAEIVALFGEGKLYERYGSTEGGIVTALRPEYQLSKIQCVGQPLAATQIAILDQEGRPVKTGEVGELYSCSPYMFSGYLNLPEATDKAMREEWFTAGDMARQDEEGFVYLVDRKNDMIISGGENVYPREVEEVLLSHPAVAEAAVVGLPHPYWGEEVTAYVVLRPGMTASPDDLAGACRAALSRYKTPKAVHLVERLPRNSMGKILRRELRQNQGKQGV